MDSTTQPQAAVAIVHTRGLEESVLLIRRSTRESDSWSGHWSFPGGRIDQDDPDPLHAALRELDEECGIRLAREDLEAALPHTVARRQSPPFVLVAPYVFSAIDELPTVLHPREAVESVWVRKSALRDPANHRLRSVPGQPQQRLFPAVEVNGLPLWGFTYGLIRTWLGLVPTGIAAEQAALVVASGIVDVLLSRGMKLRHAWEDRPDLHGAGEGKAVKVAAVEGEIPAAEILANLSQAGRCVPQINQVEVERDFLRIIGLGFDEYLITGSRR